MIAFWLAAILLVTYSIALIIAGHGAVPLGLLLVWGDPDYWLPGRVLGWASIIGLASVTVVFRYDPPKLAVGQLAASIFLYLSWFVFAYLAVEPMVFWSSLLIVSAPFQVSFVVAAGILILQIVRRHRERRTASGSSAP
jgi:hypothetical protein